MSKAPPLLQINQLQRLMIGPLSLQVEAGDCLCISGPSGSGKTLLLRALADYGHDDEATSRAAFSSGTGSLGQWAKDVPFAADSRYTISVLDHSFDTLIALNSKGKESLLRAISATAGYDGKLSVPEAELIRAVCATLQFPLPPIVLQ